MTFDTELAVLFIVIEAIILWIFGRLLRAFGAYTEAFVKAHDSDTIIRQQMVKVVEYLEELSRKENAA